MRAADAVIKTLAKHQLHTIFTLSGNQIMPLFDATIGLDLRLVHVRHEAAAVFMAEAWAQIGGQCGVALLTAGPGFANGLAALYSARASETPLLLLSGDAPSARAGMGAFQELDQCAAAAPFVKASVKVKSAREAAESVADAVALARSGRPGPVHVALPVDLLSAPIDDWETIGAPRPISAESIEARSARSIAERIAEAERPLIIVGPQLCRDRFRGPLAALSETLAAPVIHMESPRGLEDPALGLAGDAIAEADLVLLLGKAPDFSLRFARPPAVAPQAQVLQVDPDEATLDRSRRILIDRLTCYRGSASMSIELIRNSAAGMSSRDRSNWVARVTSDLTCRNVDSAGGSARAKGMPPRDICAAVQGVLDASPNSILVSDGGEFGQWAQAFVKAPRRIINGPSGAIGAAIPYAIGARLADPEATIIAMTGDGAVGFHIAEFDTAVRYNTPFVAVVGNDAHWQAEYQIQLREYGPERLIGCDLLATRYDRIAAAFGAAGALADSACKITTVLERAVRDGRPTCVNVPLHGQPAPRFRRAGD